MFVAICNLILAPRLHIQDARHSYSVMMPDYLVRYGSDDKEELQRPLKWPRVGESGRGVSRPEPAPAGGVPPPEPGGGVSPPPGGGAPPREPGGGVSPPPGGGVSPPGPRDGVSSLGGSGAGQASSSSGGAALIAPSRCLSLL